MADYIKGEKKDCGVKIQANRGPFDFVIDSASFELQKASGEAVSGFVFQASEILIDSHDVLYNLDTADVATSSTGYVGIFTVNILGRTYKFPITVNVSKIKR